MAGIEDFVRRILVLGRGRLPKAKGQASRKCQNPDQRTHRVLHLCMRSVEGLNRLLMRMLSARASESEILIGPNYDETAPSTPAWMRQGMVRDPACGFDRWVLAGGCRACRDHRTGAGRTQSRDCDPGLRSGLLFQRRRAAGWPPRDRISRYGATWRFHSEANRAAFAKDPDLYMPRYGGHDPVAVGQGTARPGDPDFWAVREKKLFCSNRKRPSGISSLIRHA